VRTSNLAFYRTTTQTRVVQRRITLKLARAVFPTVRRQASHRLRADDFSDQALR